MELWKHYFSYDEIKIHQGMTVIPPQEHCISHSLKKNEVNVLVSKHNAQNNYLLILILYIPRDILATVISFIIIKISKHKACSNLNAMQNKG